MKLQLLTKHLKTNLKKGEHAIQEDGDKAQEDGDKTQEDGDKTQEEFIYVFFKT